MLLTAFVINALPLNDYDWEFDDLGGNSPFKRESTVSTGYVDISSIEKWDEFGLTVAEASAVRTEIGDLFEPPAFSALTLAEKEIVSKWFVAMKADRDTVHTQAEQDANAELLEQGLAREKTAEMVADIVDAEPTSVDDTVTEASAAAVPAWLDLSRSGGTNQTGIVTGTDLVMNDSFGDGITYDEATGIATLKAGKVYRLFATFAFFSLEASDTVAIDWVKASDNTPLRPNHETRMRPANASSNGTNAGTIGVIYAPTVDTDVKLRCTEYTHSTDAVTMYGERSMATVIEVR